MTKQPKRGELSPKQKTAAGGGLALALAASVAILQVWEGKVNDPHWDRYGKVWDVCYGETRIEMRRYSDKECADQLLKATKEFQAAVLKLNPRLATDPYQLAAHTSFAYNLGVGTYSRSSVRSFYAAGDERRACNAIGRYRYAGKQVLRGLELRRKGDATRFGEIELCLTPDPGLGVK
jgi:lysozyme